MTALVPLKPAPTLSELEAAFADFIRVEVANGDASEDTVRNYCTQIRSWMGWCGLMRVDPAAATITDVKRFRQTLVEAGYKPSGIRGRLSIVRRFYEALRAAGMRADNPAEGVRSPRIRNAVDDFKYLSDEELTRLLSALPDAEQAEGEERIRRLRNRLLVELMALHGLRTIEVYRASVEDLTDKGANLSLLLRGKTRDRIVYLRPDTAMKVKQYVPDFFVHFAEIGSDPDKRNYIVSNQRLREAGFEAKRSLDEGIQELLKGHKMLGRARFKNV